MVALMQRQGTAVIVSIIALIGIIITGVFGLVALRRDVTQVLYFVGPTLAILVGVVANLFKLDKVQQVNEEQNQTLNEIHGQTNGQLDRKFRTLHERLDAAGIPTVPNSPTDPEEPPAKSRGGVA